MTPPASLPGSGTERDFGSGLAPSGPAPAIRLFAHETPRQVEHSHSVGQLFVLSEGLCFFRLEDSEWLMAPGRPCWIPPGLRHAIETRARVSGVSLLIDETLCARLPARGLVLRGEPFLLAAIARLAELPPDGDRARRLVGTVIDEIAAAEPETLYLPSPRTPALRVIAGAIAAAPGDDRSLDQWAEDHGLSNRTLVRRFKDETGITFADWRRRARVMRSIPLLQSGSPLRDTALAVGYDSPSALTAAFNVVTGHPPKHFIARVLSAEHFKA